LKKSRQVLKRAKRVSEDEIKFTSKASYCRTVVF